MEPVAIVCSSPVCCCAVTDIQQKATETFCLAHQVQRTSQSNKTPVFCEHNEMNFENKNLKLSRRQACATIERYNFRRFNTRIKKRTALLRMFPTWIVTNIGTVSKSINNKTNWQKFARENTTFTTPFSHCVYNRLLSIKQWSSKFSCCISSRHTRACGSRTWRRNLKLHIATYR